MSPRIYPGVVVSVHDGDTLRAAASLGFGVSYAVDIRLAGCNAAELATPGGQAAAAHLAQLLPPGTPVTLAVSGPDKYGGRWDARVVTGAGVDITARMISDGYAAAWTGTGPKPVPVWPLP